jgi:hypothetical protein
MIRPWTFPPLRRVIGGILALIAFGLAVSGVPVWHAAWIPCAIVAFLALLPKGAA